MEEIAAARNFAPTQTVVQIYGTCEECRTGARRPTPIDGATTELVFARDALRIAIATERSGLEFYTRAASLTKDARGRTVFQKLAAEEREHLGTLEKRYRELIADRSRSSSRGRRFCSSRAPRTGCSPKAPPSCARASTISRRCSSASSASAARTSSSSATASASRTPKASGSSSSSPTRSATHLDLLIREYRALRASGSAARRAGPSGRAPAALIDLHTHTTASDGRCTPAELVARAAAAGVDVLSVTDHDTVAGCGGRAAAAVPAAGIEFVPGIEITAVVDEADVHVLGYFIDVASPALAAFLAEQRRAGSTACGR